jgi:hypothetical protein
MKRGIECEGEFQGLDTLFIDASEFKAYVDWSHTRLKCNVLPCTQIYICDHKNELDLYDGDLSWIALVNKKRITIERTEFKSAPFYINIMLVVNSESFWNLRGQDQIKFSKDLNVYAIQKKSMPYTNPVEFTGDVEILMQTNLEEKHD